MNIRVQVMNPGFIAAPPQKTCCRCPAMPVNRASRRMAGYQIRRFRSHLPEAAELGFETAQSAAETVLPVGHQRGDPLEGAPVEFRPQAARGIEETAKSSLSRRRRNARCLFAIPAIG
jgi:hypothetical protein